MRTHYIFNDFAQAEEERMMHMRLRNKIGQDERPKVFHVNSCVHLP